MEKAERRNRYKRLPNGEKYRITPSVLRILEMLHWFGPLSSQYTYAAIKQDVRAYTYHTNKLSQMFQERDFYQDGKTITLPRGAGLIDRPYQQLRASYPLGNYMMHSITKEGEEVLKRAGRYVENRFQPSGSWEHQAFQAAIMASIYLGTLDDPEMQFGHQHEIVDGNPTFDIDGVKLKPDGLCYIEKRDRRFYFFIEADRDTEPNKPRNERVRLRKGKYWIDTVKLYGKLIGENRYKALIGARPGDKGFLLNVTVSKGHMYNMVDVVSEVFPKGNKYILSQYCPDLGENFKPPRVLPLLTCKWMVAGHDPIVLTKKETAPE